MNFSNTQEDFDIDLSPTVDIVKNNIGILKEHIINNDALISDILYS